MKRTRGIFKKLGMKDFDRSHVAIIGAEDCYGKHANTGHSPRDAAIWMSVQHRDKVRTPRSLKALRIIDFEPF